MKKWLSFSLVIFVSQLFGMNPWYTSKISFDQEGDKVTKIPIYGDGRSVKFSNIVLNKMGDGTSNKLLPGIVHEYRQGSGLTGRILGYFYGETAKGEVRLFKNEYQTGSYYLEKKKLIPKSDFEAAVVLKPQTIESQVDENGQLKASNDFEKVLKKHENATGEAFICYKKVEKEVDEVTLEFYFFQDTNTQGNIKTGQHVTCISQKFSIKDQWSTWSGIWQTVKPDVIKGGVSMMALLVAAYFYFYPELLDELIKYNQRIEFVSRFLPKND